MQQTNKCCADPGSYTFAGYDDDPDVGYAGEAYYRCTCGNTLGQYDLAIIAEAFVPAIAMATALEITYAAIERKETANG